MATLSPKGYQLVWDLLKVDPYIEMVEINKRIIHIHKELKKIYYQRLKCSESRYRENKEAWLMQEKSQLMKRLEDLKS